MHRAGIASVLLLAVTVAACGSGVSDHAATVRDISVPPSGISRSLDLVPAHAGASESIVVNDQAAAAEAAGLTPPPGGSSESDLAAYFTELSGRGDAPVAVAPAPLQRSGIHDADWRSELGFAPVDLTGDVSSGLPPDQLQTFFGAFDPETVSAAVEQDPAWSDQLERVPYEGLTYFSWGDDNGIDPTLITTVRTLGESSRLLVDGVAHVAYWARSTALIESALDTLTGTAPSLADDPEIGPLATALDGLGAYSAFLTTDVDQFTAADDPQVPPLEPYDAVATGAAVVDGEARLLVVLLNPDEATAAENADRLEAIATEGHSSVNQRPWSDALGAGAMTVDGRLVTASFPTDDPRLWNGIVVTRDSLIATG